MKRVRVAITGAAGQIGYALVFRIASGQMFGPEVELELNLLELKEALPALKGVCMELEDCAFPLLRKVTATSNLNVAMRGINWALLVGAVPRKSGMERADLLNVNGGIFTEQGRAIGEEAADDVRVLVVGNPCNTNALIAMHHAKLPSERFFAMTALDECRARAQLARKANVPMTNIRHMIIWGNHSATQYPDFYHAMIGDQPVHTCITDEHWLKETFVETVQKRGAAIIQARGASSAASAANAIVRNVSQLTQDTLPNEKFSVCCASNGAYGVDEGLIFSFPCYVAKGNCLIETGIEHNAYAQEKLELTLAELRKERALVQAQGLLD